MNANGLPELAASSVETLHSRTGFPVVALLLSETGQLDRTGWSDLHDGVAVVLSSGTFDHRGECAVMDATDVVEFVLVAVTLEDGENLV